MCFGDFYETRPSSISVIAWSDLADTKPSLYQIPWQGLLQNASRKPCDVKLVQFQTRSQGLTKSYDQQILIPGTQHQHSITIKKPPKPIQSTDNNTTSTQQYYSFRNAGQKHSSPLIRGRRKQTLTTQLVSKVFLCLHSCCCFCQKRGTKFKTCFPL